MAPPLRQSCDRCHSQKLRCPRVNNKLGACERCLRRGVPCEYSSSRPKGRPSVYGSRGNSPRPRDARAARSGHLQSLRSSSSQPDSIDDYVEPFEATNQTAEVISQLPMIQPDLASNSLFGPSVEQELNILTNPHPHPRIGSLARGDPTSSQSAQVMVGLSPPLDNNTPCLVDWTSLVRPLPPVPAQYQEVENSSHGRQNSIDDNSSSSDDGSETAILQLSQLIMRFARLHRLSSDLVPKAHLSQAHTRSLVDETTFGSVSEWFMNDFSSIKHSTSPRSPPKEEMTSNILCRVFSASHTFLEALNRLRLKESGYSTALRTSVSLPPTMGADMSPCLALNAAPNGNSAVRHLVITCYTMLLSIYATVLNTLEHDASASRHIDGAISGDIRLASVVQLCSYLIERQHKEMENYLAEKRPHQASWEELLNSNYDQTNAAVEEDMRNLHTEVEQRLARLKQMLQF
ncbi:hypothetical protein F4678DRAFT_440446 [Xylaria arbuscula]|nr:hypothetical protein F4678DRAFT_440446 [Xylaria arbuscula]